MQSFAEFIAEGRDAPLYHGTNSTYARDILKYNMFEGRTYHMEKNVGLIRTSHKQENMFNDNVYYGVSLSRTFKKSKSFGDIIFELDQAKLIQKYKIRPVQWFNLNGSMRNARTAKHGKIGMATEDEEFVLGSIKNAESYITTIWFPGDDERWRRYNQDIMMHHLAKPYKN